MYRMIGARDTISTTTSSSFSISQSAAISLEFTTLMASLPFLQTEDPRAEREGKDLYHLSEM